MILSKKIIRNISLAIFIAQNNKEDKFRFGCVGIDKSGKMLSTGCNSLTKTHPMQAKLAYKSKNKKRINLHAEVSCIIKSKRQIYALIVVRILNDGTTASAKPCDICMEAIRLAKIKWIIYSNNNEGYTIEKIKYD